MLSISTRAASFRNTIALSALALTTAVGVGLSNPQPSFAQAAGTVPADVQKGIDDSKASVQALSGLALVCLVVALTPLGAMLTLRFLNMVLSRV